MLLLSLLVVPAVGALICITLTDLAAKWGALITSLIGVVLSCILYQSFDSQATGMQMAVGWNWISSLHVQFALGVDGLSFPLVVLTKFMTPVAVLASWGETRRVRAFMICYLLLDLAMTGTFLATDLFTFYVFWEAMLIPMLLIIGVWGSQDRIYAAIKFFLYTFAGSILMLVAIFWVFGAHQEQYGFATWDMRAFYKLAFPSGVLFLGLNAQEVVFLAFAIAFAIKVPMFPLHTWLPDAHVQAPAGGSILLAAVLLKMGAYGLIRLAIPICPEAFVSFIPIIAALSVIGILYGAWVAFQQTDFKKLVAYSSVSHLGFVTLGLCTTNGEGLSGAMLQMVNHGVSTGALFLLVGALYERRHSRNFADFGGLAECIPWYAAVLVFVSFSSMGVPGLNGFVGEFLILLGALKANVLWAVLAVIGVILSAVYLLTMVRKVLFGGNVSAENRMLKDLSLRDWASLVPLVIFIIVLGVKPGVVLDKVQRSLEAYWGATLSSNVSLEEITAPKQSKDSHS